MEEKKHECPEDLETLIISVPRIVFEYLSFEPDIEILRNVIESEGGEVSEEMLKEKYREFVREYDYDQRTAYKLAKFGETREEIVEKLAGEVKNCTRCSEKYLNLLKMIAIGNINLINSENSFIAKIGKNYEKAGLFKSIFKLDKDYLGLFLR